MKTAKLGRVAAFVAVWAAAALAPADASAGSASASLSGLVFQLVDLDPSDGVTPSMVFDSLNDAEPAMWYNHYSPDAYVWGGSEEYGTLHQPHAGGYTETHIATDALSSSAQADQPGVHFQAAAEWRLMYTLSPNTALIAMATAAVSVLPDGSYGHSRVQFYNELENGRSSFAALRTREDGLPDAAQGTLYGSVRSDASSLIGYFTMRAETNARMQAVPALGPVTAVPEPAEWGMLLTGLAVVGCVALRGRKHRPRLLSKPLLRTRLLRTRLLRTLSFAGLAMAGGHAAAAQHASLDIGAWNYTLVDLAPQDGIAPLLTFLPDGAAYSSEINYTPNDRIVDTVGQPISYSDRYGHASALVDADGMALSTLSSRQLLASGIQKLLFTLTPNTLVEFTLLGHTELKVDRPTYAYTRADLHITLQSEHGLGAASDRMQLRESGARDFTLSGVLASQGEAATGVLSLIGVTAVYPVPEPAEWAMLLGGLAMIGMLAARRGPAR